MIYALIMLVMMAQRSPGQQSGCLTCHQATARLEQNRAHQLAGIACVDCHGGDPGANTAEAAKAVGSGYRGIIQRESIPSLCGDCHADVRRMNPFGIATDQLAQYKTSRHGEAFFGDGDERVATCLDCHGSHGILGADIALSPTHPTHVPETCAKCHSDPEIADEYGLDGDEDAAFRNSVHAKLLFEDGDLSAPQCATCHGNHGAVPPGFTEISMVCGKCHVKQRELFATSPHARLVSEGEFNACATCHGHHEILPAGDHILERTCTLCHAEGDKGMEIRNMLLSQFRQAQSAYEDGSAELEEALKHGLAGEEEQVLLESARSSLIEMQAIQHSLNPDLLAASLKDVNISMARIHERISSATELESMKRIALLPVVIFLGLMSLGFWALYRRIHESTMETA